MEEKITIEFEESEILAITATVYKSGSKPFALWVCEKIHTVKLPCLEINIDNMTRDEFLEYDNICDDLKLDFFSIVTDWLEKKDEKQELADLEGEEVIDYADDHPKGYFIWSSQG